jgi:hypothetical protein
MTWTKSALATYLYGYAHEAERDVDGTLKIEALAIEQHDWKGKVVPSGFFKLKGAENISAVIFNASATISKFNRMGLLNGFGSKRVTLTRSGFAINLDPNVSEPIEFHKDVNDPEYTETWIEGMDVYHNPLAKHPLDPEMLPGAAHHYLLKDGQIKSSSPDWQPLSSTTSIHVSDAIADQPT